jgi:repressor LexA
MANLERLTEKQRAVYEFIREKIRMRGYGPTVREIGSRFGISSPNGVMCHLRALERKGLINREPNMSRAITLATESPDGRGEGLPLRGRVAAGRLHEAVEERERINFNELFNADDHYVLRVSGDSMIEDNITDGDYVIVRKQHTAYRGQIVVAQTGEHEATLKRWYPEGKRIRLQPSNSSLPPIYVTDARVVGVVVGVLRRLK